MLHKYPKIQPPHKKHEYANKGLDTLINAYASSEVKSIIKESYGDGCTSIQLLQSRCARITPQDTARIEDKFHNTKIEPNESATIYIRRFRDARLLAKSVGMKNESSKLIDKFLLSMRGNKKYYLIVQQLLNQRRNEDMTQGYNFLKLTMTEVESQLYAEDENNPTKSHAFQTNTKYEKPQYSTSKLQNNFTKRQQYRWENKLCFFCGSSEHQKKDCPRWKNYMQKKEKSNQAKEIILNNNKSEKENSFMVKIGNAGRKAKHVEQNISYVHDLHNWVMDSGATCHMTPYKSDFQQGSETQEDKAVEVADGFTVPSTLSGTVIIHVTSDQGDPIHIRIQGVLHVPELSRRLFSLMALIQDGHDVTLSKTHGIKFNFGKHITVTTSLPNYHLFASQATINDNMRKKKTSNKKKVGIDILYKRLGHRSIKTLLSANKDEVWNDVELQLQPDIISTSDHHIATIRKKARNKYSEPDEKMLPGQKLCMDLISSPSKIGITPETSFPFYLLIVDGYSRMPKLAGLLHTTADDIIRAIQLIRTQLLQIKTPTTDISIPERIQADFGSIFTSKAFLDFCRKQNIKITLAAPKHLEMNSLLGRTWRSISHIKNTLIVHARVDETCTHFALKAATEIFSVIPIKTIRKNGQLTTSHELFTGKKPKIDRFRVMFCPCVIKKYTSTAPNHEGKYITVDVAKRFAQKGIRGMYIGFDDFTPGYLVFIPKTRQIVCSIDIVFDETFITSLAYKYTAYREALLTRPVNDVIAHNESIEHTGDITSDLPIMKGYKPDSALIDKLEQNNNYNSPSESSSVQSDNEIKYCENEHNDDPVESVPIVRRSNRIRRQPENYAKEWVSLVTELNDELVPWHTYGDPSLFIPEPKGL